MKHLLHKFTVQKIFLISVIALLIVLGTQFLEFGSNTEIAQVKRPCISTFEDGDGPYYQLNSPFRTKLSPSFSDGTKLTVKGRVLKNDCLTAVDDVVLDIWHADPSGKYQNAWYRGKVRVDEEGNYEFETNMPKGYGEGTGYRPPHIHFKVESQGRILITSEMFFPDVKGKEGFSDAYIVSLEEKSWFGSNYFEAYHDIILP
jgi:protocatechuate 3,4-dioxygenase beta subunit